MLVFYETIFRQTSAVAGWTEGQYLFFLGTYFALEGVMETFFLGNCSEFSELVRTMVESDLEDLKKHGDRHGHRERS